MKNFHLPSRQCERKFNKDENIKESCLNLERGLWGEKFNLCFKRINFLPNNTQYILVVVVVGFGPSHNKAEEKYHKIIIICK